MSRRILQFMALALGLAVIAARAAEAPSHLPAVIAGALPSVVSITTKTLAENSDKPVNLATAHSKESFGSGFVIDKDGYIATNRHVVDGAFDVIVTLSDGTRLSGNVVGKGRKYDLALIKVNVRKPLTPVVFADSLKLKVGDSLVVVGNPYGLGISASSGIVSALGRNLRLTNFDRFIQTDAAINHGNSGGPVFDMEGKVVGMSTALYTGGAGQGGSIGIGFAIPSSIVESLLAVIRRYGYIHVGSFEVDARDVTADIAGALGIERRGVIVAEVDGSGPAGDLLQTGDVILALDGTSVDSTIDYYTYVGRALDRDVSVRLWRAGKILDVNVRSVQWADEKPDGQTAQQPSQAGAMPMHFGVDLAPITQEMRTQFNLAKNQHGLVVTAVAPDTPGAAAGFSVGDVIERVQVGAFFEGLAPGKVMTRDEMMSMMKYSSARIDEFKKQGWPSVLVLVRGSDGVRFVTMSLADWME
jgi:serine protease Do